MQNNIQILRTIDKFDKIGKTGVIELLQKPETEFGAGLDSVRATFIGAFLDSSKDSESNEKTIEKMKKFFDLGKNLGNRLKLIGFLEEQKNENGKTAFDTLLEMPINEDQTWKNGARPANIAWCLDDIMEVINGKEKD